MVTLTTISNIALMKLGVHGISDLEEDSQVAKDCKLIIPHVYNSLLRQYSWGFAEHLDVIPRLDWEENGLYRFRFPSDYISLLKVEDDWEVRGQYIYKSNPQPITLRYIRNVEDPNEWDVLFRECVVLKLAIGLCDRLVQSDQKKNMLIHELKDMLSKAEEGSGRENEVISYY